MSREKFNHHQIFFVAPHQDSCQLLLHTPIGPLNEPHTHEPQGNIARCRRYEI